MLDQGRSHDSSYEAVCVLDIITVHILTERIFCFISVVLVNDGIFKIEFRLIIKVLLFKF